MKNVRTILLGLAVAVPATAFGLAQSTEQPELQPAVSRAAAASPVAQQVTKAAAVQDPYTGPVVVRDDAYDLRTNPLKPCAGAEVALDVAANDTVSAVSLVPGRGGSRIEILDQPDHAHLSSRTYDEKEGDAILHYLAGDFPYRGLSYRIDPSMAGQSLVDEFTYRIRYGGTVDLGRGETPYSGSTPSTTTATVRIVTGPLLLCDGL